MSMGITPQKILAYTLLPGITPRVRTIFGEGFGFIPYCMANIFAMCRLVPNNHPYLNPVNMGRFGIHHVLGLAAAHLRFRIQNTDQIIIFMVMLAGTVLLLLQIALFMLASYVQVANAQSIPMPVGFAGFFISPNPTDDISFMVMDRIFGIPNLFNSCVAQNIPCIDPTGVSDGVFPAPYHIALHNMLGFYSWGIMAVGLIILLYYIATIVSETVMSGTPFGKRFNRVWAPLRLVVALGLLLPMNFNLNAAQYIALYITKFGSAFATNGWNFYLASIANSAPDTLLGQRDRLVARPGDPGFTDILQFMMTADVCRGAYRIMYSTGMAPGFIDAYFMRTSVAPPSPVTTGGPANPVTTATTANPRLMNMAAYMSSGQATPIYTLQQWAGTGNIHIVFGHYDDTNPERYQEFKGGIRPYCGEVVLESDRIIAPTAGNTFYDGVDELMYFYMTYYVWLPWTGGAGTWGDIPDRINRLQLPQDDMAIALGAVAQPTAAELETIIDWYKNAQTALVDASYATMTANIDWTNTAGNFGWAGAAIWYNKIAEHNGTFTDAVFNMPRVASYPELMERIQADKAAQNAQVTGKTRFDPVLSEKFKIRPTDEKDLHILMALNQAYKLWEDDLGTKPAESKNVFMDLIDAVFKQSGLWSLRDNENVHPLASMASLGRSMLINSVISFGSGTAAGALNILGAKGLLKQTLSGLSSFMMTVAYIGLATGIMLYYVVPFLPFIYFFFSLVSWAKTIFEAMVGVPLWALAHLRYDGEGFPTRQSLYGYYLLIDIFLRPILTVFGLIGSIMVFYAMARTLNGIFDLVVSNAAGFNMNYAKTAAPGSTGSWEYLRNPLHKMFFTIIYAIIIYMIGMSSFKMIDQIPNNILRWMGGGARSFGAMTQRDAGQEVASNVLTGSKLAGDQLSGMAGSLTRSNIVSEADP